MEKTPANKKKAWIIAVLTVTILAVCIFIFRTAVYQEFNNLKLTPEPETFTELYFTNPNNLPTHAGKGEKGTFSFTVHNVEGVRMSYPYSVYFLNKNNVRSIFAKGTIVLDSGASTSIVAPYQFSNANETGMVVVMLTSLKQQIDFLIPDNNLIND